MSERPSASPTMPEEAAAEPAAPEPDYSVMARREDEEVAASRAAAAESREAAASASRDAAGSEEPRSTSASPPLVDKELRFVRVFYGTNRARTDACLGSPSTRWDQPGACRPNKFYGDESADRAGDDAGLEVGELTVSFPPKHETGQIERPRSFLVFTLSEDPDEHVMISKLDSHGKEYEAWISDLQNTGRSQAFIYVHGFATTFDTAARRAAQVAFDLDFDQAEDFRGVPMMYSWPSKGRVEGDAYAADYDTALAEDRAFNRFLDLVKVEAGIERVHVIAHSMGNLVVASALERRRPRRAIIDQLTLAAPDIPSAMFADRFVNVLPELAERVTLYVSDSDKALKLSSQLREGVPRVGQVASGFLEDSVSIDGFDGIDATDLPSDFLDHSYWANNNSMLADIYCLLKQAPVEGRPLLMLAGPAWRFKPPYELARLDARACTAVVPLIGVAETGVDPPVWRRFLVPALLLALLVIAAVLYSRKRRT